MIYFVIVNYYSSDFIASLIRSIQASRGVNYTILIINNSPDDDSIHHLEGDDIHILEAGSNLGFGQACNLGLNWIYPQDTQAIVWIINPDAYLLADALEKIQTFFAANTELSIVGTIVYTPTGEVWFAGGEFSSENGEIRAKTIYNNKSELPYLETTWVSGCSLLINLKKFHNCPQFDSDYFLYYEDFDFCRRYASQGHLIAIAHKIGVVHHPSSITSRNLLVKFKHSTYSYLLAVERYAKKKFLILRLTRLVFHAIILIPVKPQVAFGKLHGILLYLRRVLRISQKPGFSKKPGF
ncbi:glycosyltransferase family 2 protein [Argonema antarcticum]|uniref:glycosyltransferase family 2 protein n=1 Tax=Argonema antarcticum TaxID=2942763 RepID=UPI0020119C2F|nr:glycosyltransferase [Argonema antarcticum A004/B2]